MKLYQVQHLPFSCNSFCCRYLWSVKCSNNEYTMQQKHKERQFLSIFDVWNSRKYLSFPNFLIMASPLFPPIRLNRISLEMEPNEVVLTLQIVGPLQSNFRCRPINMRKSSADKAFLLYLLVIALEALHRNIEFIQTFYSNFYKCTWHPNHLEINLFYII